VQTSCFAEIGFKTTKLNFLESDRSRLSFLFLGGRAYEADRRHMIIVQERSGARPHQIGCGWGE